MRLAPLPHESIPASGRMRALAACSSRARRTPPHLLPALGGTRRIYLPPTRARRTSNTGEWIRRRMEARGGTAPAEYPGSGSLERKPSERSRRLIHRVHPRRCRHPKFLRHCNLHRKGAILARICRQQQDKCPIPPRKPCSKSMVNLIFAFLIVCLLLVRMHQID